MPSVRPSLDRADPLVTSSAATAALRVDSNRSCPLKPRARIGGFSRWVLAASMASLIVLTTSFNPWLPAVNVIVTVKPASPLRLRVSPPDQVRGYLAPEAVIRFGCAFCE
ncbi:MAG: hypothetical protein ACFFDI_18510 [Promethearchaeota archaeon]